MREMPSQGIAMSRSPALYLALFLAAIVTLALGVFPGPVLEFARASAMGIAG